VYLPEGAELARGQRYKRSIVACAGDAKRYELRGYVDWS
jgi:hypothetical protein